MHERDKRETLAGAAYEIAEELKQNSPDKLLLIKLQNAVNAIIQTQRGWNRSTGIIARKNYNLSGGYTQAALFKEATDTHKQTLGFTFLTVRALKNQIDQLTNQDLKGYLHICCDRVLDNIKMQTLITTKEKENKPLAIESIKFRTPHSMMLMDLALTMPQEDKKQLEFKDKLSQLANELVNTQELLRNEDGSYKYSLDYLSHLHQIIQQVKNNCPETLSTKATEKIEFYIQHFQQELAKRAVITGGDNPKITLISQELKVITKPGIEEHKKELIEKGGRILPFNQRLDPLKRELGSCVGYVSDWSKQIAEMGFAEKTPRLDNEVLFEQLQSKRLDEYKKVFPTPSCETFAKFMQTTLSTLDESKVFQIGCKSQQHAMGLRKVGNEFEFFDPNFAIIIFKNNEESINWFISYLKTQYNIHTSEVFLDPIATQPTVTRPSIPEFSIEKKSDQEEPGPSRGLRF